MIRHYNSVHEKKLLDCPMLKCSRKGECGFTRHDHLVEHLRGYHGEDIAKRPKQEGFSRRGANVHFNASPTSPHSPKSSFLLPRAAAVQQPQNISSDITSNDRPQATETFKDVELTKVGPLNTAAVQRPVPTSHFVGQPMILNPPRQISMHDEPGQQDDASKM